MKKRSLGMMLRKKKNNLIYRTSVYQQENILDFSHTALAIAPNHPYYGKNGEYQDFGHYDKYSESQLALLQKQPLYFGSTSKSNLKKHYLQRLSYNPDFDYLASEIEQFLVESRG